MDKASLEIIGVSLGKVASALAERRRQEDQGASPPFDFVDDCLNREANGLRGAGQEQLADALAVLRDEIGAMDNG